MPAQSANSIRNGGLVQFFRAQLHAPDGQDTGLQPRLSPSRFVSHLTVPIKTLRGVTFTLSLIHKMKQRETRVLVLTSVSSRTLEDKPQRPGPHPGSTAGSLCDLKNASRLPWLWFPLRKSEQVGRFISIVSLAGEKNPNPRSLCLGRVPSENVYVCATCLAYV